MWKDLFNFNRAERRGIWILGLLTVTVWIINLWFPFSLSPHHKLSAAELANIQEAAGQLKLVQAERDSATQVRMSRSNYWSGKSQRKSYTSAYQTYEREPQERFRRKIELNSADSALLDSLPGIGKVLSSRIIKYRNRLGGFYTSDQLLEVYGLKEDWLERYGFMIFIDTTLITGIDVRNCTFKEMLKHPYTGYDLTKNVFNLRRKGTLPGNATALCQMLALSDSLATRLRPYLFFSQANRLN